MSSKFRFQQQRSQSFTINTPHRFSKSFVSPTAEEMEAATPINNEAIFEEAVLVDDEIKTVTVTSPETYTLPDAVPKEIVHLLETIPFFSGLQESSHIIEKISKVLLLRKYQMGDVIVRQGESARAMFFIVKGSLKVISDDGEIDLAELTTGSYFGEIGIVFDVVRTATVVAKTPCTLLTLTAESVAHALESYPEIKKNVTEQAQKRLILLAKEYEKSGKKISSDVSKQIQDLGLAADLHVNDSPTTLHTRSHNMEAIEIMKERSEIEIIMEEEEDLLEEDAESPLPIIEMNHSLFLSPKQAEFKPLSSANILSKKLSEKRRASVAVWSDDKLMQFAKEVVSQSTVKENRLVDLLSNSALPSISTRSLVVLQDADLPKRTGLFVLGNTIICSIISRLDFKSILSFRRSCKEISTLVMDPNHHILSSISLAQYSKTITDAKLVKLLEFVGPHVHDLSLKNCWPLTDTGMGAIAQHCPKLTGLDLSSVWEVTDVGLLRLAPVCHAVSRINLSNCRKITDTGLLSILTNAPKMASVQVSYCKNLTGNVMNHSVWSTIKEVNFQRATTIRDDGFINWKSLDLQHGKYFALEDLNLSDCSFLTDTCMQVLAEKCPQLKRLCLSFCCSLSEKFANYLVDGCPFIEVLDVSYCGGAVTDNTVMVIAQGLPRLHSLGLRGCVQLSDLGIQHLATNALALATLNFTQCKNVSPNICKKIGIEWNCVATPIYVQRE